jgi:hypothetical protein
MKMPIKSLAQAVEQAPMALGSSLGNLGTQVLDRG